MISILFDKLKSSVIGFALVMVIWYLAHIIINNRIMPSPFLVMQAIPSLLEHNIQTHFFSSMYRLFMGLLFSMLIGLTVGMVAANKIAAKLLTPFLYFTYPIPRVALMPVVFILFGLGDTSKIIIITLIVTYPIIIVVRDSVKDIPKETYNPLICLGASRLQMFFTVTLPWAVSGILSTMRISLGTAIAILFLTEAYGTNHGMGLFIFDMLHRINYVLMYAGIAVLSITGFLIFIFIDLLEELLLKWKKTQ